MPLQIVEMPDFDNAHLCEHPNEVPSRCPCGPDCYCRGRMCDLANPAPAEPVKEPKSRWDRLILPEE